MGRFQNLLFTFFFLSITIFVIPKCFEPIEVAEYEGPPSDLMYAFVVVTKLLLYVPLIFLISDIMVSLVMIVCLMIDFPQLRPHFLKFW
ncbi:Protein CBG26738 [Caenorhabditis briggsae]|uniref:Uncharacterized protein n=2 Tax=Caenorhabditis briggsae TaxID=6238 RepID=A0AAE9A2P9_CAEBR|nr:Protein CBG26738 [Caenorhabditis briggsae]ULT85371.1 hypothetical protein L3Y34_013890 [Caenorhabditis briggsae]ULT85381.1 hypothetical protein L3Y34_013899 [Caenorhabditis briggsae]UMM44558.1 hypothetical protein L5515_019690 [Caenorhabditis briggsae]CAS01177.1 Protein CBG26738 [Caenorhabditis briggsae]